MADIWNLNALCRCCHKDGYFRSMQYPYVANDGDMEMYSDWLKQVFGINMVTPEVPASDMICEECVTTLRDSRTFRQQVTDCEMRFQQYCTNEANVKVESDEKYKIKIKLEKEGYDNTDTDFDNADQFAVNSDIESDSDSETLAKIQSIQQDSCVSKDTSHKKQNTNYVQKECKITLCSIEVEQGKIDKTESKPKKKLKGDANIKKSKSIQKSRKTKPLKNTRNTEEVRRCKLCGQYLKNQEELKKHMDLEHNDRPRMDILDITCQFCNENVRGIIKYRRHISKLHPGKGIICNYCPELLRTRTHLRRHVDEAHKELERYICDYCQKQFLAKVLLKTHILQVHMGVKKAVCPTCGLKCNDVGTMKYHVAQVHENIRSFQCEHCPKNYKTKRAVVKHTRVYHTFETPYVCEICDKGFAEQSDLTRHIYLKHKDSEQAKKYAKKYASKEIVLEPGKRLYRCFMCKEIFQARGGYRRHLNREHKGMKP